MEAFLQRAGWNCWHCGIHIPYPKVSNAAHVYPKGRYPELACDMGNFYLLCCAIDVTGRRACHAIMDGGCLAEWEELRDSVMHMGMNLTHRSELSYQPER